MNKAFTVMALVAGLVLPSFAQFDGFSSFEPQSVEGVHRRPHGDPPPPPPPPPRPRPVERTVISTPDSPVRLGGRVAIGIGEADGFTNVNAEIGGAVHVRVMPMIFGVAEIDFSIRNFSKAYDSDNLYGYYCEFEDSFTQLMLDIPLIGRFQPVPFFFLEGGIKVGINLASMYSDSYTYYTRGTHDYVDSGSFDEDEWDANPVTVGLLVGGGFTLMNSYGRDIDVGVRFVLDMNSSTFDYNIYEKGVKLGHHIAGKGHPWAIQFQVTYLL